MEKDKEHKRVKLQLEREFINFENNPNLANINLNNVPITNISKPIMSSSPIKSVRSRHNSYRAKSLSQENLVDLESKLTSTGKQYKATLFDYLRSEMRRGYLLENDGQRFTEKREKFYIFLTIPKELEQFIWYGFFQCVDAFLFIFTLLPFRFALAIWFLFSRSIRRTLNAFLAQSKSKTFVNVQPLLQPAEICDLLKGIILICCAMIMNHVNTSILYHLIRSQSIIKLYIIYNMLEVADKLISSFGQDILDTLYWTATENRTKKRQHFYVIAHTAMAILYVCLHTILLLLQATTLNVALNSKSKALLTIMMSNNFVELKGMVFKKFEKNNLFHMSCNDVKERFQLLIILTVVIVQTMKELNWVEDEFWNICFDCGYVFFAEFLVDWVKHAFVTRFNEISSDVYQHYTIYIAYDLAGSKLKSAFSDHSDLVSRRMGFIPLPLSILVYKIFFASVTIEGWYGYACLIVGFLGICTFKFWINIFLLGRACDLIEAHREGMEKKAPTLRQCASMPSSRHHSTENLANLINSKSTPHTPIQSQSSSLVDISAHASMNQDNFDKSLIFSDSTVTLNSLEMNDGSELRLRHLSSKGKENEKAVLDTLKPGEPIKRKTSLQEKVNYNYIDIQNDK